MALKFLNNKMSRTSYILLSAMPSVVDYTGIPVKAAGWYGHTKGLHTISICVHSFQGRISIQGSQALNPTDNDWFSVPYPSPYTLPYIQYPRPVPQLNPNTRNGETSTFGFNFNVNCLWLRATVTRDYLFPVNIPFYASTDCNNIAWLGAVDTIIVNY
jgi:hypothetical protein